MTRRNFFVGKYGHTFDDESCVVFQFYVKARTPDGNYALQFFEWMFGEPSSIEIRSEQWFIDHHARFYEDQEQWRDEGDRQNKMAARHRRRQSEGSSDDAVIRGGDSGEANKEGN